MASYVRTKTLRSQLVVHALCLALVLEGCRMEIGVLAEDFKLSLGEARGMFRELVRNSSGLFVLNERVNMGFNLA